MKFSDAAPFFQKELQKLYGSFLELGEIGVLRRSGGRRLGAKIYITVAEQRFIVGLMELSMNGELIEVFGRDRVIECIRDAFSEKSAEPMEDFFLDFDDEATTSEDLTPYQARERLDQLLQTGTADALAEARNLYPLLLANPDTRGAVLHEMALLELALKNTSAAENLFIDAVKEYANLAQIELIERVVERLTKIVGAEAMKTHDVTRTYHRTQEKLRAIKALSDVSIFKGLPFGLLTEMEFEAEDVSLAKGEVVISEGEPATRCLIIRSGTLDVVLEGFEQPRTVRSCFPGEFLGENAVLHPPGTVPTTASLRAAREPTRIWKWEGQNLITLMARYPELEIRIRTAKEIHQLDSFFSMHETLQFLDVTVRDAMLDCLYTVDTVEPGRMLIENEEVPEFVFLVIKGRVEWQPLSGDPVSFGVDSFVGMRDALHEIAIEGEYHAAETSLIAVFESEKLRALAVSSPPSVVAILERLH
ncbi:cyclic nucleotide-binding domain-containing protein [Myxococcota bacterium]|nr:cyclic nucleotide-binding domain-containing protein [Myxococcota bacterium]